jgi:hypothetical protein
MNVSRGYRFEATQAVRTAVNRAVVWGMLDITAKVGIDNPVPRHKEQHRLNAGPSHSKIQCRRQERRARIATQG